MTAKTRRIFRTVIIGAISISILVPLLGLTIADALVNEQASMVMEWMRGAGLTAASIRLTMIALWLALGAVVALAGLWLMRRSIRNTAAAPASAALAPKASIQEQLVDAGR